MSVYAIDPLKDPRWADFVENHPLSSVFHTPGWLETLRRTYGYEPVVLTTSSFATSLSNGIPFCRISHWFSGRHLVSLPFSDHCMPLTDVEDNPSELLSACRESLDFKTWKYMEFRIKDNCSGNSGGFENYKKFFLHCLDLRGTLEEIVRNFHSDCVQRKIERAEREKLSHHEGVSEQLLKQFYQLLLLTRRRHGLPPQPISWFRNLIACLPEKLKIRVACKDGRPIAGVLTLQHKKSLVYKYGCSDQRFNNLGGMQMLLWHAIQDAKGNQLAELDMGRCDVDNPGLITFKERWGATRSELVYLRYPRHRSRSIRAAAQGSITRRMFAHMPESLLSASGRILYRYMG